MMKKISVLAVSLFVLAACSNNYIKPTTNEVLFTIDGREVKESNWFEVMKRSDSGALVMNTSDVLLSQDVSDPSVDEKVNARLEEAKTALGDSFLETLKSAGFATEDDYKNEVLYPQFRMEFLIKQSMEENYTELAQEYLPKKASIAQFADAATATTALERIKAGEDVATVSAELGSATGTYTGAEAIYNIKGTEFPSAISTFITRQVDPGLSEVLTDATTGVSYIVQVIETQADRLKDEVLELWTTNTTMTQAYKIKMYQEGKFKVHDKDIYDALQTNYKDYLTH